MLEFGICSLGTSEREGMAKVIRNLGGRCVPANKDSPIPIDYLICAEGSLATAPRVSSLEYVPRLVSFKCVQPSWVYKCQDVGGSSIKVYTAFRALTWLARQTPGGEPSSPPSQ